MGKITKEQQTIIDSLTCERLTKDEANKTLIQDFENNRNKGLADSLREEAWEEDANGSVAYYLIKDKDGNALFFFSLKCGALFEQLNEERLKQNANYWKALERILKNSANGDQTAVLIMEKLRSGKNLTDDDLKEIIKIQSKKKRQALEHLLAEKKSETNENIVRVSTTHSGVELVHFCANDNKKQLWKTIGLPQPLGVVIFWNFIVPRICEVQNVVGCKYAFLFAADLSEDGSLINYYQTALHFEAPEDIGTSKPFYDFTCKFMCQTVNHLLQAQKEFFDSFNPDEDNI